MNYEKYDLQIKKIFLQISFSKIAKAHNEHIINNIH